MKKTKMSLCLASGFVAALSLAACSGVSSSDTAVVTIKDYNGNTVDILTDAIYNKYRKESSGVSKYYNAILEALIRYEYSDGSAIRTRSGWTKKIKTNAEIEVEAKNNVKNDKNTAQENADSNGTSYDDEWNKILDSHNCEDEAELLQYYIYQLEKDDITDKFFLYNKDSTLTTEWIGITDNGEAASDEVAGAFPYHIRHVLASIEGGDTKFYDGTITADEAKNLGNIMEALLSSQFNFSQVAEKFSGDPGSKEKGGDSGIVTTTTSYVNEFKLGVYAYDAIYHNVDQTKSSDEVIRNGLGIDGYSISLRDKDGNIDKNVGIVDAFTDTTNGYINGGKIQEVPYEAFLKIKEFAEIETDDQGKQVNKGKDNYYPRNVLFNYYLNFHNPFVITNNKLDANTGLVSNEKLSNAFFNADGYLCDSNDPATQKVIIGVRGSYGVHLMTMEKSIFEFSEGGNTSTKTSLEDYYTSLVPSDANFPHDPSGAQKQTYVNFIETSEPSTYNTRASDVKSAVKSFDSTYDYRLYEYILNLEGAKIEFRDQDLQQAIDDYISRTRSNNKQNAAKTLHDTWRSYVELIALQYDNRTNYGTDDGTNVVGKSYYNKIKSIHPRCAIKFSKHKTDAGYQAEIDPATGEVISMGACYYEE